MKERNAVSVRIAECELILTRIFDAPRELVFKVWTDPKHVVKWWGPNQFTNPVCEMDLRPGGKYRFVMRSPDGVDYPVTGSYLEIVENERIVFTDLVGEHPTEWIDVMKNSIGLDKSEEANSLDSIVTVTFEDYEEKKTKLTIRSRFESNMVRDGFKKTGMVEGWTQSLERFEDQLSNG
ncbi:hypothetical protein LEP1GSC050_0167 [Leptospira broomii serovar Hurstbridge str. 5399]|uniref:Activator of Hsp90 ATPase homologue 1/2-like C-terminal domain-containing protein n=1 Tax=Leptospira broomii serovar Hurstbridge str. 5399 TaxID=1049789 RepID=T0GHM4_9LEPT|nr:SRPBCC domain-containing protein [Leptospira broomii]EQA46344.1 hypothetical protein LEP1GSC050_0167 [Leptospira broomii serovar Hurstbridge str. 5399]